MSEDRDRLSQMQRDALWKWRWLGFRNSTPAFKASLIVLGVAAVWIATRVIAL
jgi:hypothetical protein